MLDIHVVRLAWFRLKPLAFAHHYHAYVIDDYGHVRYNAYGLTARSAEKRCFRRAMKDV